MNRKALFCLIFFFASATGVLGQTDTVNQENDTTSVQQPVPVQPVIPRTDSPPPRREPRPEPRPVPRTEPRPEPVTDPPIQRIDTVPSQVDTTRKDSLYIPVPAAITDTSNYNQYFNHPYLGFDLPPVFMLMKERVVETKDTIFYLVLFMLFFVAFTRLLFPKYFHSLFRLFFQSTFRQRQTREQLLQQNLGSMLMNILFFFSGGLFLTLVLEYYQWSILPFWKLLLYSSLGLALLYIGKFLFLTFAGWVFNAKEGAETYIFIVFLINKVIGVMLIPFILVIAFSDPGLVDAAIAASLILLGLLFFYRYFVSLNSFRRDLSIRPFHFFLYLCGVEIAPLLVLAKVLVDYFDGRF